MTTIINLTPHPITIGSLTLQPTLPPARAGEWVESADPIVTEDGWPEIPTSWVTYTRLENLPAPAPDVYYVVSLVVAQAAAATHRTTADLLTPGEQVRDDKGRVIGCKSLARVGRGIPSFRWRDQREAFIAECLRQGGSSDVGAEREVGHLGRYARNYASAPAREDSLSGEVAIRLAAAQAAFGRDARLTVLGPATTAARPGDRVTFFCGTRKGRGVHLTGVPFSTTEEMDAAYATLASGGATCNDARPAEREIAAATRPDAISAEHR